MKSIIFFVCLGILAMMISCSTSSYRYILTHEYQCEECKSSMNKHLKLDITYSLREYENFFLMINNISNETVEIDLTRSSFSVNDTIYSASLGIPVPGSSLSFSSTSMNSWSNINLRDYLSYLNRYEQYGSMNTSGKTFSNSFSYSTPRFISIPPNTVFKLELFDWFKHQYYMIKEEFSYWEYGTYVFQYDNIKTELWKSLNSNLGITLYYQLLNSPTIYTQKVGFNPSSFQIMRIVVKN